MLRKTFDGCVKEVTCLVAYEFNWAPEPTPDVLVEEFGSRGRGLASTHFGQ